MSRESKPFPWWLRLAIAILSAIAGMVTENATDFLSNLNIF